MKRTLVLMALVALGSGPASAQRSTVGGAIQNGQVGERYDGYLAIVGAAPAQVQRQVASTNIQRRKLYIELAERRNVSPELVGMVTACQLFSQLSVGQAYMLKDGVWRRRAAGQPVPLPDYCR